MLVEALTIHLGLKNGLRFRTWRSVRGAFQAGDQCPSPAGASGHESMPDFNGSSWIGVRGPSRNEWDK